jgi:hypothetical protein
LRFSRLRENLKISGGEGQMLVFQDRFFGGVVLLMSGFMFVAVTASALI